MLRVILTVESASHKNSCTTTYIPSHKLSRENEQDMLDSAGEVGTNS